MAIELHHLHPGHDDEVSRLKARIAKLERMDTEYTLQIAKMNGYIGHLEEERRWRKCSQELPEDNVIVLGIVMRYDKSYYYILNYRRRGSWFKPDYPEYWMPLPHFEEGREL